ncbi:MAG: TolC family protein [Acidobacteria bacterium]|nr:TolC family protein [Acidobacteriota bacterium]
MSSNIGGVLRWLVATSALLSVRLVLVSMPTALAVFLPVEGQLDVANVPDGLPPGPIPLSFQDAVSRALRSNLTALLAGERKVEARGRETEARANLLPNLSGSAYQANVTRNLAAFGFRPGFFPGFSTFVGPFSNFDARLQLVQSILDLDALWELQAGRADVRIAGLREQLARRQVTTMAALAYLEALRAERGVDAARANVEMARSLLTLAQDQRNAGIATGVDVSRAETRLAEEQVRLTQAQTASQRARLQLLRGTGLPLGGALVLTDSLQFTVETLPSVQAAMVAADHNRIELRIAEEQVRLHRYELRAAQAERLPSLEFVGDYGPSGINVNEAALPTRSVAVRLNVPIFDGGTTRGRIVAAGSRRRQAELELDDLRAQVEEEVRLALQTLGTTAEQVRAADQAWVLAQRELQMARDRFAAGVTSNIEVMNAQTALASARDAQTGALAQYNTARINLAAVLGSVESFRW